MAIEYAKGACRDWPNLDWDVPEFTVKWMFFVFHEGVKPEQLGISLDGYKDSEQGDPPSHFFYANKESGITYTEGVWASKGIVVMMTFDPPSKFDYIKCKKNEMESFRGGHKLL